MENYEKARLPGPIWIRPDFNAERGEIERTTKEFLEQDPTDENIAAIYKIFESAPLVELSNAEWEKIENTDSFHNLAVGDIETAEKITEEYNEALSPENKRNFQDLLRQMQGGSDIESPVIVRKGGRLYLVSGNTRLMIARALSYRPMVVLADIA